jgi:hypothetical protein
MDSVSSVNHVQVHIKFAPSAHGPVAVEAKGVALEFDGLERGFSVVDDESDLR